MSDRNDSSTRAPATPIEGTGTFYLGVLEGDDGDPDALVPYLYDSRDLTTHAVALGMTGSGKTGLCITLIEEAALDGVPTIAVDLKGDIANLMLLFPDLEAKDFLPWIDEGEAQRKGRSPEEHAAATAALWRKGLAGTGQDGERIGRLREAVDMALYTPGATHGRPLAVLRSFAAPSDAIRADSDALGDRVTSAVSGLLALIGEDADPLQSREHILLSRILHDRWREGTDLDLAGLIHAVQEPGFSRLGVMDIESFFPADDRFKFAARLNNLIAAPGFEAWLEGDPLDVDALLWTDEGKPRVSIVSVAHLDDAERMFFLTTLLNEIVAWVRTQPGTSSLRALLYIDEVFGYLPPSARPPSKPPLLTLLKQARAFGFGVVLATQNPVDLDYKALGNTGTWFLGRLQTERDKGRVLDGLEGVEAVAGGGLSRKDLDARLSGLETRQFVVNNVHEEGPVLIRTRWAMSYLRGPLARPEIARLAARGEGESAAAKQSATKEAAPDPASPASDSSAGGRPMVPPKIDEVFDISGSGPYRAALLGVAELHYTKRGTDLDHWKTVWCLGNPDATDPWLDARVLSGEPALSDEPVPGAKFEALPDGAADPSAYRSFEKRFASWLYREEKLELFVCDRLDLVSEPGETEADFRRRLDLAAREARDGAMDALRKKYAARVARLERSIGTAEQRVRREESQYEQHRNQSIVRLGNTVLGAFLGRKKLTKTNLGKLSTTASSFGRASKQKEDVDLAEDKLEGLTAELAALESELESELRAESDAWRTDALAVERDEVAPRKSDIGVKRVALAWIRDA